MLSLRLFTALLAALALSILAYGQSLLAQSEGAIPSPYRIYFTDQADLQRLAGELDVWAVSHAEGYLVAPLTGDQLRQLRMQRTAEPASLPGPLPAAPLAAAQQSGGIPGFACYRTVEETSAALARLSTNYPQLAEVKQIGVSWDKQTPGGPPGHDLELLVLTNRRLPGPKFRFFLLGAIHARELVTAETALRFAEMLLQGYGEDADATWLLDHGELHVLPIANPDGRLQAEAGILWRKNTNFQDAACTLSPPSYSYGVDLNRNSSFQWNSCPGCSSAATCSMTYRGPSPGSEPETQALEAYMRALFADLRGPSLDDAAPATASGLMISLHSYGPYVLYPWGWSSLPTPNGTALQTLARKFGFYLGYPACQAGSVGCFYQTDGTTDDYAYGELGVPGYTIEMGSWFFESCDSYEAEMAADALNTLRYAFKAAQAPYLTPAGPEITAISPGSTTLAAGDPLTLTARADDTRSDGGGYGGDPAQPIQAMQVALDTPPWNASAVSWSMRPTDGSFDQAQEEAILAIETACWAAGRHMLYLRAQDSTGQWGVPSAIFVEVTDGANFEIQLASPSAPLYGMPAAYTLAITNTAAVSATFALAGEADAWSFDLPAQPIGPLAPGETRQVSFTATAPSTGGELPYPARIVVTSSADPQRCLERYLTRPLPPRHFYFPFLPLLGTSPAPPR